MSCWRLTRWVLLSLLGLFVLVGVGFGAVVLSNWAGYQDAMRDRSFLLSLAGEPLESGSVGYKVGNQVVMADVQQGENAGDITKRLRVAFAQADIEAELVFSRETGYSLALKSPPERVAGVFGLSSRLSGVRRAEIDGMARTRVIKAASEFYSYLAADWPRMRGQYLVTEEFFDSVVVPLAISLDAAGETLAVESFEDPAIHWYDATIMVHLARLKDDAKVGTLDMRLVLTTSRLSGTPWIIIGQTMP